MGVELRCEMATEFERELLELKRRAEEQSVADERERQASYTREENRQRQANFERSRLEEERRRELSKLVEPFKPSVDDLMNGLGSATFGGGNYGLDFFLDGETIIAQKNFGAYSKDVVIGKSLARWEVGRIRIYRFIDAPKKVSPKRTVTDLNYRTDHNRREFGRKDFFELHLTLSGDDNLGFATRRSSTFDYIKSTSTNSLKELVTDCYLKGPDECYVGHVNSPVYPPSFRSQF